MDFIKENKAAIVVAALIAGMVTMGVMANMSNNAKDAEKDTKESSKTENKKADKKTDNKAAADEKSSTPADNKSAMKKTSEGVSFTAADGDSYTTLARQAVQDANEKLTKAQIIAAETYLAQAAGEPAINEGESVTIKAAELEKAVKKAENLSKTELAAWQAYVPYVQF